MSDTNELSPEACHGPLVERAARILGFDAEAYFPEWQSAARRTFKQLLGGMPARGPLNLRITGERSGELAREIDFVFTSEPHADVPATLLVPLRGEGPFATVICMQGHGQTMNVSLGRAGNDQEREGIAAGYDFARQAVRRGYAALAFDMRALGARGESRPAASGTNDCHHAAMTALLLGRTLAGERVFDVSRAIDALETFGEVDRTRIACMGHSGGGVIAYYAAAFDPRIAAALCSGSVCAYRDSIAAIPHCADNYLPGILHYLEMSDIAGLIAPRPLAVISGEADPIFPAEGVRGCAAEIKAIYELQNAAERFAAAVVPGGHAFFAEETWALWDKCWR